MAVKLNVGKCTLLGNYRENNEDAIEVKQFPDLFVMLVADGMGGQAAGEIASRRAIEVIPRELRKGMDVTPADSPQPEGPLSFGIYLGGGRWWRAPSSRTSRADTRRRPRTTGRWRC